MPRSDRSARYWRRKRPGEQPKLWLQCSSRKRPGHQWRLPKNLIFRSMLFNGSSRINHRRRLFMTRVKESLKLFFKSRIRSRYTIGVINYRFAIGKHTRDSESHRDAMISVTL